MIHSKKDQREGLKRYTMHYTQYVKENRGFDDIYSAINIFFQIFSK